MADSKAAPAAGDGFVKCLAWAEIREPGAYVDVTTGKLYRISQESLAKGTAARGKPRAQVAKLVQVSRDPSIFALGARMLCAKHRITADF
jgi:hypothetical protein